MDFTKLKNELSKLYALAQRWNEQGYAPDIERDIAKDRLRKLYDKLNTNSEEPLPIPRIETQNPNVVEDKIIEEEKNIAPEPILENIVEETPQKETQEEPKVEQSSPEIEVESVTESQIETKIESKAEAQPEPITEPVYKKILQQDERYIQELFNGDREFYQIEIGKLIQMNSIDQIAIYIADNFSWSAANNAADSLVAELFELKGTSENS